MKLLCSLNRGPLSWSRVAVFVLFAVIVLLLLGHDFIGSCSNGMSNCRVDVQSYRTRTIINKNPIINKNHIINKNPLALFNIPPAPKHSSSDHVALIADDIVQKYLHYEHRQYTEKILILTPIQNVAKLLRRYAKLLKALTYPHNLIAIAFGEDSSTDATLATAEDIAKDLQGESFSRVDVFHLNITEQIQRYKHHKDMQLKRRKHLAKARNLLFKKGTKDENWTLWIDSDISELPIDIIQQLLSADRDIVVPNCLYRESSYIERVFDKNTWRETPLSLEKQKHMASDSIMLEGYSQTLRIYLPDLKAEGRVVPIDGVGGCTLLIRSDHLRNGLKFPENIVDHHIETEGLAKLAKSMGIGVYGMPFVNVYH